LNGLIYGKAAPNNILDHRFTEYENMVKTALSFAESLGYNIVGASLADTDPTHPTLYMAYELRRDGEQSVVKLAVPLPDRNISFKIDGHRWIPTYQITDTPMFKKEADTIILQNTYCVLLLGNNMSLFKIKKKTWPVFLLLVQAEGSFDAVLDKLHISYTYSEKEEDGFINIPVCADSFITLTSQSSAITKLFLPFATDSEDLQFYKNAVLDYDSMEDVAKRALLLWQPENKINNLILTCKIVDNFMVPNGFFHKPFSMIDLLYFIYQNNITTEMREINDISKRRVRLGEWLLYKLAQQHKNNILKNSGDAGIFGEAIIQTLHTDERRILDDSVNPLGELCIMSRIIYNGPGGIGKNSCNPELRNLHESYKGVIDPMDTPTGDAIGVSQHIVPSAQVKFGTLKPAYGG